MILFISMAIAVVIGFKFYYSRTCGMCNCDSNLEGKVVIVTGGNTGIGYETAKDLARRGAKVILACRSIEKGTEATNKIIKSTGNTNVVFKQLNLCSFRSVRNFADNILENEPKLDVLINNAGTGKLDNSLTEDNLPIEAQVNHFAPFLLTILLMPLLKKSAPSRIIILSSLMHKYGKVDVNTFHKQAKDYFEHMRVYSNTKLANVLFTKKLSENLHGSGVTANCVHPGAVSTDIFRDKNIVTRFVISFIFRTPFQGAQTSIYLAVAPELKDVSGKYFADCSEQPTSKSAQDTDLANKLWDLSYKITFEKKSL